MVPDQVHEADLEARRMHALFSLIIMNPYFNLHSIIDPLHVHELE